MTGKSAADQAIDFGQIDRESRYKGVVTSNMFNGLPYLGVPLDVKKGDGPKLQPQAAPITYTKQLFSKNKEDIAEYNEIRQSAVLHKAVILVEERQYNAPKEGWDILISWADLVYTTPREHRSHSAPGKR